MQATTAAPRRAAAAAKTAPPAKSASPAKAAVPAKAALPAKAAKAAKAAVPKAVKALAVKVPAAKKAAPPGPPPAAETEKAKAKPKHKLVRDSFTIPKNEYLVLEALKSRALSLTQAVKKSELLRAGIAALDAMDDAAFLKALDGVPSLKTGRPRRDVPAPALAPAAADAG